MTNIATDQKKTRTQYFQSYKVDALALQAEKIPSGAVRLTRRLSNQGLHYNRKTVTASMKRQGLRAKAARKFKATHKVTITAGCIKPVEAELPCQSAESKMGRRHSYLWTDEGWRYLAFVLTDWSMAERMTAKLVCDALPMALFRRKHPKGVIVHSDRGSQYCSHDIKHCYVSTNAYAA